MVAGTEHQDFFAQRVSAYGKATINFDDAF
jgi:hypothetical protein